MAVHQTVIFVLVVVIVCNAVLYPSLFSTIFQQWFGWSSPPKEEPERVPEYPPHLRGRTSPGSRPPQFSGKEASAYMTKQSQEGGGRGMMGTILPVYAVGIFIYFGYVIYKIFLKEKPSTEQDPWNRDADMLGPSLERQQEENLQRQLAAELRAANYDGMQGHGRRKTWNQREGQPATKTSPTSSPRETDEVNILKSRLEQTEKTMDKMMEMMSNMGVAFNQVTEQLKINPQQKKTGRMQKKGNHSEEEADEEREESENVYSEEESFSPEEDNLHCSMEEDTRSEDSLPGLEDIALTEEGGEIQDEERVTVEDVKLVVNNKEEVNVRRRKVANDADN